MKKDAIQARLKTHGILALDKITIEQAFLNLCKHHTFLSAIPF